MEIKVINSKSAIYPTGGGNWLTESYPTMFHHQWKEKILTDMETPEMYKEVTAGQWLVEQIHDQEHADAGEGYRTALTPLFEHLGAVFNDATGYYEMNGLNDLTEADMMEVLKWAGNATQKFGAQQSTNGYDTSIELRRCTARTLPEISVNRSGGITNFSYAFSQTSLESIAFRISNIVRHQYIYLGALGYPRYAFWLSSKLRIVTGLVFLPGSDKTGMFAGCSSLERLEGCELNDDLDLSGCVRLEADSVEHLIRNRYGEYPGSIDNAVEVQPFTLTLHPTAYARITPELFALAAEKQITIASA